MNRTRRLAYVLMTVCCGAIAVGLAAASDALPSAYKIVMRYDEALGGQHAILRHVSSTSRGTMEIHELGKTEKLPFVYFAAALYRRLEKVTLPNNMGQVLNGFDGETAWSFDPRPGAGAQVYEGAERESMKRDADFFYSIDELRWFKTMETVGIEDFEGRASYRLHGINNWGKSNDHFYDRETRLLAGYEFNSELGATREIFMDYKKVDSVLVPMKQIVKVKSKDGGWEVREVLFFESVTFNDVDSAVFAPPAAVRELLKSGKPATTPQQ